MTAKNSQKFGQLMLFVLMLASCIVKGSECDGFPKSLSQSPLNFNHMPNAPVGENYVVRAIGSVEQCYDKAEYAEVGYDLEFRFLKQDLNSAKYLVFDLRGIEDLRLAFKIDKKGKVTEIYEYSALS